MSAAELWECGICSLTSLCGLQFGSHHSPLARLYIIVHLDLSVSRSGSAWSGLAGSRASTIAGAGRGGGVRRVRRKLLEREHGTTCARSAQKDEVIEKIQEQ